MVAEWSPSCELDGTRAASSMPDHPNVWTDVALSLIGLLVYLLQVLASLLNSLKTAGVVAGGIMLMVFVQVVKFRLEEVSVLFLGLSNLFRELRCGVSFWLCSLLMRFTWVLTICGWFGMLVCCLMAKMVLLHLSL